MLWLYFLPSSRNDFRPKVDILAVEGFTEIMIFGLYSLDKVLYDLSSLSAFQPLSFTLVPFFLFLLGGGVDLYL